MTVGHKHRVVRVRRGGRWTGFLIKPRYKTKDKKRVDSSPYPYGCLFTPPNTPDQIYYLSILGVLHRWTGLTLEVEEP